MRLRIAAFVLGIVTGFVFGWARLTDPESFHRMLSLDSARIYLLMGAAVAVAFVGARLLRGRRMLAVAVTAGVVAGVAVQPAIARAADRRRRRKDTTPLVAAADVL